ncbi:MAG TPA: mycothiol conjugate amidase Mca [Acidimicrobiales bacterium]|nr:mycothiol conjugate amidase Mca [Acidimicrobiales bacterium]
MPTERYDGLCLMTVHAHPDDEASKGAGTVARYHAAGVRTVLVTCTGGEEGDILNPAMDRPEVRDDLPEIRRQELARATALIGYDEVVMLGYRDSGMPDTPANADPRSFARAPLDEAVGRLVEVIRRERPQVMVTYHRDQRGYPHPDHLRVNEISEIAFDAAGDPDRYPDAGPPWQPARLCYVQWSVKRMRAMHEKFLELGLESPYTGERMARWLQAEAEEQSGERELLPRIVVDITDHAAVVREGLLAHATQVDPNSRHWFGLPPEIADRVYPYEEYEVARDLTGAGPSLTEPVYDLFAGVDTARAAGAGRTPAGREA